MENWPPALTMFARALVSIRILSVAAIGALIFIALGQNPPETPKETRVPRADVGSSTLYTFNVDGSVEETGAEAASKSPYWWLDSGGRLLIEGALGKTIQGALPANDVWYKEYAKSNPTDTDGGKYPQNLFRLVSRSEWSDVRVEASFWVKKDNLLESENRNASNGLFLMSRYSDEGQTLYYAGVRVDGNAVIKKKYGGVYYTMAQKKIFSGTYDREDMPDILPSDGWLRLRSETVTNTDGSVSVRLSLKDSATGRWKLLLSALDDSQYEGTKPIVGTYPVGVRTDFMDVHLDDILMESI